jgi:hypothetical protein
VQIDRDRACGAWSVRLRRRTTADDFVPLRSPLVVLVQIVNQESTLSGGLGGRLAVSHRRGEHDALVGVEQLRDLVSSLALNHTSDER